MVYGAVINDFCHPILTTIGDFLKAEPGDQLLWEPQDDGTVKIRKAKQRDLSATFATIDQLVSVNGDLKKWVFTMKTMWLSISVNLDAK